VASSFCHRFLFFIFFLYRTRRGTSMRNPSAFRTCFLLPLLVLYLYVVACAWRSFFFIVFSVLPTGPTSLGNHVGMNVTLALPVVVCVCVREREGERGRGSEEIRCDYIPVRTANLFLWETPALPRSLGRLPLSWYVYVSAVCVFSYVGKDWTGLDDGGNTARPVTSSYAVA